MTLVKCVQCPKCREIIFSRARHDCRSCKCGSIFIDGGFDYVKIGYDTYHGKRPKIIQKWVKQTKDELFADWNSGEDRYGKIKD